MIRDSAGILAFGWAVFHVLSWLSRSLVSAAATYQLLLKSLLAIASLALIAIYLEEARARHV